MAAQNEIFTNQSNQINMNPLFKKLNFKDHKQILVLNPPASFETQLEAVSEFTEVKRSIEPEMKIEFAMAFVTKKKQIDEVAQHLAPKLDGDAILWMCYPKASSKKYSCDFNRDTGWEPLGRHGLEGVRQVAIDDDWSALRFRKVQYIKTLKRKFATLSEAGKKKAGQTNA
jgi:hypothetical protein